MRFLITGGAGFVGSHLTDRLVARGDEVVVLDDLSTSSPENIEGHIATGDVEFVEGCVTNSHLVESLMSTVDRCYHLASAVGVQMIVDNPLESMQRNTRGMETVIAAAAEHGVRLLVASTSEIYGKSSHALHEDSDRVLGSPSLARWTYANAKVHGEMLAYGYHRAHGAENVVVRLFNTVGPRQSGMYGMVVPRFVRQALRGEDITVYGDGRQSRCFTHVDDAIEALLLLIDDDAAIGHPFNIGQPNSVTIQDLAARVIKLAESDSKITHVPYEEAYGEGFEELGSRVPDTTRLEELTGWRAQHSIEAAIADIITHEREALEQQRSQPDVSEGVRSFLAFGGAALLALITVPLARRLALAFDFHDHPRDYKKHAGATPYLGGVGVLAAFLLPALALGIDYTGIPVAIALTAVIALMGTIDDRRPLGPGLRFAIQVGAAVLLYVDGIRFEPFDAGAINLAVTVVWVVGLTNAFNLLDNIDGATGTTAAVAGAGIGGIALERGQPELAAVGFALSGACLAFLLFNFSDTRKIFLGDGGSMPIGFLIAALTMLIPAAEPSVAVLAAVPLAGIAIFDTTLVVVSRLRRGAGVLTGGRDHSTHRLLPRLGSPKRVCAAMAAAGALLAALSGAMFEMGEAGVLLATAAYVALGLVLLVVFEEIEPARRPVEESG